MKYNFSIWNVEVLAGKKNLRRKIRNTKFVISLVGRKQDKNGLTTFQNSFSPKRGKNVEEGQKGQQNMKISLSIPKTPLLKLNKQKNWGGGKRSIYKC